MVIEYIGEVIRTELSELREKLYEARVSDIYMASMAVPGAVSHIYNGQYGTPWCCKSHL